jgi:hypothetical protein
MSNAEGGQESGIDRLVREARDDAEFFHNLIYDTEAVLGRLDYLTRQEKARILEIDPDALVAGFARGQWPGAGLTLLSPEACGVSCGGSCSASCAGTCAGSCGGSCGGSCAASCGGSCGASCASSCVGSCGVSCAASESIRFPQSGEGDVVQGDDLLGDAAEVLVPAVNAVRDQITQAHFSRFRRQSDR